MKTITLLLLTITSGLASAQNLLFNPSFESAPVLGPGQSGLGVDDAKLISTRQADPRYLGGISGLQNWNNALQPEGWSDQGLSNRSVPGGTDGSQYAFINTWNFRFVQTTSHILMAGDRVQAEIMLGSAENAARAGELAIIAGPMDSTNVNLLGADSIQLGRSIGGTAQWTDEVKDAILPGIGWNKVKLDLQIEQGSSAIGKPLTFSFKLLPHSVGYVLFDAANLNVAPVPEPATLTSLFGILGLASLRKVTRRRRQVRY